MPKSPPRRETVQGAAGQGGDDVRVADGEGEVGGEWKVNSGKLKRATQNRVIAEIAALEGKLSKAREVKAGMMSVLLMGMVRLV